MGVFGVAAVVAGTARLGSAQDAARINTCDSIAGWQAVAPGVVEPGSGEIKILAPVVGRIAEVSVAANDTVVSGEPLLRLDDEEAQARAATARAQVAIRERVRNQKAAGRGENRRIVEDEIANAEATLVEARAEFDTATLAKRAGGGSDAAVTTARAAWTRAQENLNGQRTRLRKLKTESGTLLPTEKEGELEVARSELRLSIAELEKLTIRAPIASTVLQVNAKVGEVAAPTAPQPLMLLGDLSTLRVRAELDERDVGKIAAGDKVMVHANAIRGRQFVGTVAAISPMVRPARSPDSPNDFSDFGVNEVLIDLDDPGPLLVEMKVDVYFRPRDTAQTHGSADNRGR
jgi:HlyD family secretion protein